jgi:hypothetical protein
MRRRLLACRTIIRPALTVTAGSKFEDRMLQAVCFIYPWDISLPDSIRFLKDSYCVKVSFDLQAVCIYAYVGRWLSH